MPALQRLEHFAQTCETKPDRRIGRGPLSLKKKVAPETADVSSKKLSPNRNERPLLEAPLHGLTATNKTLSLPELDSGDTGADPPE